MGIVDARGLADVAVVMLWAGAGGGREFRQLTKKIEPPDAPGILPPGHFCLFCVVD
jgi:hypothetical protein